MEKTPALNPVRTCIHTMPSDGACGSPAMRNSTKCYFHHGHRRQMKRNIIRRTLRNPNGRMDAIEMLLHGILTKRIDPQTASALLYAIHLGTTIDS